MTRMACLLLVASLAAGGPARGDEQLVKRFDGHDSLTTADFSVPDGWEIRWHSNQVLSLGVIRRDNTVVAGTTGRNLGSLYLPQGGTYRIRVKGADPIPWDVAVFVLDKNAPPNDEAGDYYAPTEGPAYKPITETNAPPVAPDNTPPAPVVAVPPAPPPLPTQLSADQLHCLVVIKGDRATGTGFFLKLGGQKLIVTTQHLLADNPNWKVYSSSGNPVEVTKIEGATDRDVALLSVKDFGYAALEIGGPAAVQPGDAVLTGSADGTVLPAAAVIAFGPRRIEIDQLHSVPGAPVVLAKSGQVVGIVAMAPQPTDVADFNDQGFDERDAAARRSVAAFGLRLDNIPSRETYELAKLQVQAQFLDTFHQHSRTLDAYLNGNGTPRDVRLWQGDEKLKTANDNFLADIAGGDPSERTDALHALLFELGLAADADFDQVQAPSNFYSFPGQRAKDEAAYRQALKNQLDAYSSNVAALNSAAARNN